jgi:putative transposase
LVETQGVPRALEVGAAQRPDVKLLTATLEGVVVEPPDPNEQKQHMCLDKAYAGECAQQLAEEKGYEVPIPDKANAKKKRKRKGGRRKARRWVVKVTHSWLNRFRRLLVRGEKKTSNSFQGLTLRALSSVGESTRSRDRFLWRKRAA